MRSLAVHHCSPCPSRFTLPLFPGTCHIGGAGLFLAFGLNTLGKNRHLGAIKGFVTLS